MSEHVVFIEMSGSGAGQKAIEYALRRGYDVTLLTARSTAAVPPAVAAICQFDTADADAVATRVLELHRDHAVNGVTTTHDLYVPQAARAAEELGLPGMGYTAAAGVRNKHLMRQRLAVTAPQLNPAFRLVENENDAVGFARQRGYPVIAKPPNAFDSWNVERLDEEADVRRYMRAAGGWTLNPAGQPIDQGVLMEEFVDGSEHSVETAQAQGGPRQLLAVTTKELAGADGRHFAEIGVALPVDGPTAEALFGAVSTALDALGVTCGVVHTECRVRDGQVVIIEVNPRLVGEMTGSHMIELALGADPIAQVVDIALGAAPPWAPTRARGAASYGICAPASGRFAEITNVAELAAVPGVAVVREMIERGAACCVPPRSNGDFVGRVVTTADTVEQALELAREVARRADVRLE
jgi:biotin carboxylase